MKILFAARSFDDMAGGVERMSISIMNEMVERGHEVSLFTWDVEGAKTFYAMSNKVNWLKINLGDPRGKAGWWIRIQRAYRIRKMVRKMSPDLVLAFQHGIFFALRIYTVGMGIPFIAAERNAPSRFEFISTGKYKNLIFQSFRLANKITVQLPGYVKDYPKYLQSNICVIPNRVEQVGLDILSTPRVNSNNTLLAVGRLSFQKNFKLLIKCFSSIADEFPEWNLLIAGNGEEYNLLNDLISSSKLEGRVVLLGVVIDVESLYLDADLFCLPSLWEGFPNSLAEALSYGVPSIGFEESAGVADLIIDKSNGLLAKGNQNKDSLSCALRELMGNPALRKQMSNNAVESVKKYEPNLIFDQWENLFQEVAR